MAEATPRQGPDGRAVFNNFVSHVPDAAPPPAPARGAAERFRGGAGRGATDRTERLYAQAAALEAKKARLREQQATAGCTFKPKVTKRASSVGRRRPLHERLYEQARERQRRAEAAEAAANSPPPPPPPAGASPPNNRHERLFEQAAAAAKRREEAARRAVDEQCTFRPAVGSSSSSRAARRASSGSRGGAATRLYQSGRDLQVKAAELEQERERREMAECTFKPSTAARRPASAPRQRSPAEVASRLFDDARRAAAHREELREQRRAREEAELTFKPRISRAAAQRQRPGSPHHRLFQDANSRAQRLSSQRAQAAAAESREHRPHTNTRGPVVAGSPQLFERLYKEGVEKQQARLSLPADSSLLLSLADEEAQLSECTFRPKINRPRASY